MQPVSGFKLLDPGQGNVNHAGGWTSTLIVCRSRVNSVNCQQGLTALHKPLDMHECKIVMTTTPAGKPHATAMTGHPLVSLMGCA